MDSGIENKRFIILRTAIMNRTEGVRR